MRYYIYILECSNGSFYTGYTTDMRRRYKEHLSGSYKCKYTRSFPPKSIAVCWRVDGTLSQTLRLERRIKSLSRLEKISLISSPNNIAEMIN